VALVAFAGNPHCRLALGHATVDATTLSTIRVRDFLGVIDGERVTAGTKRVPLVNASVSGSQTIREECQRKTTEEREKRREREKRTLCA
jgi:hypothetical protein